MKILLIEVKSTSEYVHNGLAYLASSLSCNHQLMVFDLNLLRWNDGELINKVSEFNPDIIGFSMKSSNLDKVRRLAILLRNKYPKAIFVVGGPHITLTGIDFLKESDNIFNYGFVGEAETSFSEFCDAFADAKDVKKVKGLVYQSKNQWLINPIDYNSDLNKISFPDYSSFIGLNWSIMDYPLLTSRGCPYQCIYCSVREISGRQWRFRFPQSVINELKQAKEKYKIRRFSILDDNFTLDKQRAIDFCDLLIKGNINLGWGCPNGLRADSLDKELINKMKEAGCDNVAIGIESGDEKVFDFIQKGENLNDIKNAISLLSESQIRTTGFLIIGLPYDSIKATKNSLKFIESLNLFGGVKWSMLVPYPRTFIWDWVNKRGKFLMDFAKSQHFIRDGAVVESAFETEDFSAKQRKKAFILANISTGAYHIVIKKTKTKFFYKLKILFYLLKYNPQLFLKKFINKLKTKL